jgi:hypothetical protein
MAGPGCNPFASNRHADVLNENPADYDEAGKLRLVEEIKSRAKGAFQSKDMPSAELLYSKAIELTKDIPDKQEPTFFSNRAMVRLNLNKPAEALEDCKKCLALDPKSVKTWHRKADALTRLGEWDDAIAAAEEGQKLEPSNASFAKLIEKANADKAKDAEDKARLKRDAQDVRVELHNASTARQPVKREKKAGEEGEDTSMRGYKTTKDGKTTSYFHTEISDEAKALIAAQGFGKPQKLDAPVEDATAKGGGSSWNQAGTYEEKGMLKWVQERLPQVFKEVEFEVPTNGAKLKATGADDVKGEANISSSRGKRRFLLDLTFSVPFVVEHNGEKKGGGKYLFTEAQTDEEPEMTFEMDSETPPEFREVLNSFAKPAGQGLMPVVRKAWADFVVEYKTK